jgi:hypothetical protein
MEILSIWFLVYFQLHGDGSCAHIRNVEPEKSGEFAAADYCIVRYAAANLSGKTGVKCRACVTKRETDFMGKSTVK